MSGFRVIHNYQEQHIGNGNYRPVLTLLDLNKKTDNKKMFYDDEAKMIYKALRTTGEQAFILAKKWKKGIE